MRRPVRCSLAIVVASAACLAGTGDAARHRTPSCQALAGHGLIVAASTEALAFRAAPEDPYADDYIACHLRSRRLTDIGSAQRAVCCDPSVSQDRGARTTAVQGRYAAFATQSCQARYNAGCTTTAHSFDTQTGRSADFFSDGSADAPAPVRLVVASNGMLALSVRSGNRESRILVSAHNRFGDVRTLDAGSDVDAASLAVAGRRVYWTHDGRVASAVLAAPPRPAASPGS